MFLMLSKAPAILLIRLINVTTEHHLASSELA